VKWWPHTSKTVRPTVVDSAGADAMIGPGPPMRRLPHRRFRFSSPKGTPLPFSLALKAATNQCGGITAAQMIRIHPSLPGRPTGSTMASTILVIDDDDKLNRLLKRFLKDYGFEVYSALDADEGLKKCEPYCRI
jgi:hypothetical protein